MYHSAISEEVGHGHEECLGKAVVTSSKSFGGKVLLKVYPAATYVARWLEMRFRCELPKIQASTVPLSGVDVHK